ncbi:MAG: hypothetical protein WC724_03560, partial [Candidatus Paceibacterota bacterium]
MSKVINTKFAVLLTGVVILAALVAGMTMALTASAATYNFATNLKQGMTSSDVMNLQKLLNSDAATQIATTGAGAPGNETSYFGSLTKAAVIKWQNKHASSVLAPVGLSAGTGYFGASSRAFANGMTTTGGTTSTVAGCTSTAGYSPVTGQKCDASVTTTPTTPGVAGSVSVSGATQPGNSLLVQSASRVAFTKVTLTAGASDVTVNSVTVERAGLANDAVFAGVVLLDEDGTQIGIAKTLNSNHQASVGDAFVIRANTSRTMTIAGNSAAALTAYAGQVVALNVVGLSTSATVSGSMPITGAMHTVNASLAIGTANGVASSYNPSAQDKDIGTTNYKFSAIRIEAGSAEDVRLRGVRFYQAGSAASSDLANVKIAVDGTLYDTTVSSDGKYYNANFGSGIVIAKGLGKDIWIQGDIVGSGSSARTVDFDIQKNTDVYVTGETYGYGIIAGGTITTASPSFNGVITTIRAGTVNAISKSNTVAAQNIGINVSGQVLGAYETDMKGEAVSVQSHVFHFTNSAGTQTLLTSVSLYNANGTLVAGPQDAVAEAGTNQKVTFTDTIVYPVGKAVYTLKGKVASATANGMTFTASTTPSTDWSNVTGQTTGTTITLPSALVAMNIMTAKAPALAISVSTQPTARTVIAGAQGFEFARYNLDAGQSGEDVKMTTFKALLALSTVTAAQLSSCNLYDGTTNVTSDSSVTVAAGDNNFTFNGGGLMITKGTQKILSMKCNVSAAVTTGSITWGLTDNASTFTGATGFPSGQTVAETMTAAAGQAMTVATSGSYTVTSDSSLLYKVAQAGTTGVTLGSFRFTAGGSEAVDLKQIAFQLGNTASNSPADLVNTQVSIWNGSTQVGTAQFGGANPDNATSTVLSPAPRIAAGESIVLTVKGDLSAQNINEGTPGAFLAVTYDGDNNGINGNYATGVDSQVSISGTSSDVTTNGLRIYRTVPTFAVTSTGGSLALNSDL